MERERVAPDPAARPKAHPPPAPDPPAVQLLLRMQRSAGNHAVAGLLARDPKARGGARAQYVPTSRYIRVLPGSPVGHVMHELTHAWDNVRTGKLKPLSELLKAKDPGAAIAKEHARTGALMWSDATTKHATKDEKGTKVKLTIQEMLDRYKDRHVLREQQFGTPGTREGYSQRNVHEFYAEAFAVFHAGDDEQKARLEAEAPEIFHLLESESSP